MKYLYLSLAFLSLTLGAVGAFLPVLPTVPLLLLASFFFAKGSTRYHKWFTGTKLYQKYLKDYTEHRAMTLGTKLSILLPVSALLFLSMILVDVLIMRIVLTCLIVVKYYYFIFKIKTIPKEDAKAKAIKSSAQKTQ